MDIIIVQCLHVIPKISSYLTKVGYLKLGMLEQLEMFTAGKLCILAYDLPGYSICKDFLQTFYSS